MQRILPIILFLSILHSQKIFESFDLDSDHSYMGTSTYEFTVDENGKETRALIIKDIMGDINIIGRESYKVNIVEEVKIKSSSERKAKKYYRSTNTKITKSKNGNLIEIKGKPYHHKKIHYKYNITLPSEFNIKIMITGGDMYISGIFGEVNAVTSGGDIELSGITGKISAKSSGGDIDINDSEGNVNLSTSGGDIQIRYTQGQITGKTSGGDIEVYHVDGNVYTSTNGGSIEFSNIKGQKIVGITSGGDVNVEDIQGNLDVRTSGGDITIEDVNGNVKGNTSGGDIDLESVNGHVEIYTNAGSIHGKELSGSIKAETSNGEIEISKIWNYKLNRHDINLKTSYGNINLAVPHDFPSRINAQVSGNKSGYKIKSNLPITITSDFDDVYGHLVNGDGTFIIELHTTHGNIIIEEN